MARAPRQRATPLASAEDLTHPPVDLRTEAAIAVLAQMRDSLSLITKDLRAVSEQQNSMVLQIDRLQNSPIHRELQELKQDFKDYKDEREKLRENAFLRIQSLELQMARYQGLFMPLAILGSAVLTGIGSVILDRIFG